MITKFCKDCRYFSRTVWLSDSDFKSLCTNPESLDVTNDVVSGITYNAVFAAKNRAETGQCKPEGVLFEKDSCFNWLSGLFTAEKNIGYPL